MTEGVLNAACVHWGLGEAMISLVADRENKVFRADGPNGTVALRLHRPGYRSADELRSELMWMGMLVDHGVSVPAPVLALDGSPLLIVGDTLVDVLSWLGGAPLNEIALTSELYFDLGGLLARMHDLADGWAPPADFTRPTWDVVGDAPSWGRFWENPKLDAEQRAFFKRFRDVARDRLGELDQPDFGLIHADLVLENVLLQAGVLQPIDFDDGGFGHRLFDLATISLRSRRHDPMGGLAEAAVAGYREKRALDRAALPLFEALRACSYVGWNITRMDSKMGLHRNVRFIRQAQESVEVFYEG